jgi:hypothetical protein
MDKIAPYGKAITGAIVAFLTAIATATADNGISGQEWVTSAIAFFVALGAVWAIPNRQATAAK